MHPMSVATSADASPRILLVEDSAADATLITRRLTRDFGNHDLFHVSTFEDFLVSLSSDKWDIILCDYRLGAVTAESFLEKRAECRPDVPFILVSGSIGEERAADLMRLGAADLVLKGNLSRLVPVVERELKNAENRRDQRRMEDAVKETEERFRAIFELSNAGIALLRSDGRYEMGNPAFCEMVGHSQEELKQLTWRDVTPEEDVAELEEIYSRHTSGERESVTIERRYKSKDGNLIWASITSSVIPDDDGKPKFFVGLIQDITERREAEHRLQQSQKMEAVGQLTGGIAHDFNNILAVILGNLELLMPDFRHEEDIDELIEIAIAAVMRGTDLTRQLLAFSRRQELEPRTLNINELVAGMDKLLRRTIGEDIQITTALGEELGLTKVDPAQLESAILNLAINARDAMANGGRLLIETSNADLDDDYVELNPYAKAGPHVCVSVCDTGTGIAEENLEKIFDPFFTTKEVGKGTGLGLSMVFGFVKQSGGHINVYSEIGQGTRFQIYLPRNDEAAETLKTPKTRDAPVTGSGTILVVEDEDKVREVVTQQLEKLGYDTLATKNALAAIEIIESDHHLDLMITDMIMPGGINGHELAERAKALRPDIKVLLTSGYPRDAFSQGRKFPLISKPFSLSELSSSIKDALHQ